MEADASVIATSSLKDPTTPLTHDPTRTDNRHDHLQPQNHRRGRRERPTDAIPAPSPNSLLSIPLRAALCRTQMKFRYQTARPGTLRPNALPVEIDLIMFSLCPRAMEPITSNNIHCFSLYTYISLIHACSHSRSILLSRKSQSGTTRPRPGVDRPWGPRANSTG